MTYPATNSNEATKLIIDGGNQLHEIINEDALTTITTESGEIPSVRKAITDTFLFQEPIVWDQGSNETVFNQLRTFNNETYWAPTATVLNPIPMGVTPVGDSNWNLAPTGKNSSIIQGWDNQSQEELINGKTYPEIGTLSNGDIVPAGTTHLRVLAGGESTIVSMSPVASGAVSSLTENGANIGASSVVFSQLTREFYSVSDLIESNLRDGARAKTGNNTWEISTDTSGMLLASGFYAKPTSRMMLSDFIRGKTTKADRTTMAQLMLDLMVSTETPCRMDISTTLGTLTISNQWGAIDVDGLMANVGYQGAIGTELTFEDEDGLIIPLASNNHYRCAIKEFKMTQSVGSRQHNCIKFEIDGTRTFNYPIKWFFDDLSPNNWENQFAFVRNGGAVDPDGFFGKAVISRLGGFNNGRTCLFDGVYANLFSFIDCRIHAQEEHVKLQNGSGAFVDHINVHFEGVDIPRTSGLFVYDGTILESRFTFHNHDWENCGRFIHATGNPTSTPRFTFTGKNRWNSYLTDPQELPHIRLANYSSNRMLITPNKTIVDTPETVDVQTVGGGSSPLNGTRIRHYFVPESAANNTHMLPIAQAICGAPSADAAGYGGYFNAGDKYIKAIANAGLGYFFSNSQVMKTPNVTSDSHLALSFAAKFTQNVTRVANPLNVTINANLIQWFNNPFQGDTGRYICVILIEVGTGFTVDSITGGTLISGSDCSIGYSHWHEGNRINCHDALPVAGNKLLSMWKVPASGNIIADVRGGVGEGTNAKFTAKIAKGVAVSEHFVNGDDSVAANRTLTEITNTSNADGSITATRGGNYDLIQYTFTNNTLSDVVATAITELL